jgi:hypothetical protein
LQLEEQMVFAFALLGLRMTFGGSPNPAIFCKASDCVVDLAIALSQCPDWSPQTLRFSYSNMIKDPVQLTVDIPFTMDSSTTSSQKMWSLIKTHELIASPSNTPGL